MNQDPAGQELLLERAAQMNREGETKEALELLDELSDSLDESPASELQSRVFREVGLAWRTLGDVQQSRTAYERALSVARACRSATEEAFALNGLAVSSHLEGDLPLAEEQYAVATRKAAQNGLIRLTGMIEQNRGVIANIRGDLGAARTRYKAALAAFQMTRDHQGIAWTLNNLAMLSADLNEEQSALQGFSNALAAAEDAADLELQARIRVNRAEVLIEKGANEEARQTLESALSIAQEAEYDLIRGEALRFLARLERRCGNPEAALEFLATAAKVAQSAPDVLMLAEVRREMGACWEAIGDVGRAKEVLEQAAAGFETLGATDDLAHTKRRIASL